MTKPQHYRERERERERGYKKKIEDYEKVELVNDLYYLRLNDLDLQKIGTHVKQVPSKSSILAANGHEYYKVYPTESPIFDKIFKMCLLC